MDFYDCYHNNEIILMEGAIGERLKREYSIYPDRNVALAGHIYQEASRHALKEIFGQYIKIAEIYKYPMMLTTPSRKANKYHRKNWITVATLKLQTVSALRRIW